MTLLAADAQRVTAIAIEVFAGMVDGRTGLLTSWSRGPVTFVDPLHASVSLLTEPAGRVQLSAEAGTAVALTRALLKLEAAEPVSEDDVVDAFGEITNIFGGNIKALLNEHVDLTLPQVTRQQPHVGGERLLQEVVLDWRGSPLVTSVWTL